MTRTFILAVACLLVLACDQVNPLAPTGSTVTLQLSATIVPIHGTIQVRGVVVETSGRAPQDGTMVTFVGGFGTFTPTEAPTLAGVASSTFTATGSGLTKFGAYSGGAKALEVDVKVGNITSSPEPPKPPVAAPASPTITLACGTSFASVGVPMSCTMTPTAGGNPIQIVAIEWGDGTAVQNLGTITSTQSIPHTFTNPGGYVVTATVIDTTGQQSKATVTLIVSRSVPTVSITGPPNGTVGTAVVFSVGSSSSVGLSTSVVVDFGDGTSRSLGGGSTGVTKAYSSAGIFTVTATVTDTAGTRNSDSTTITMASTPPPVTPSPTRTSVSLTQEDKIGTSDCAAFVASALPATGTSIRSIVVTHPDGRSWSFTSSSGRFATCGLTANTSILTATATDSAGGRATFDLIVR